MSSHCYSPSCHSLIVLLLVLSLLLFFFLSVSDFFFSLASSASPTGEERGLEAPDEGEEEGEEPTTLQLATKQSAKELLSAVLTQLGKRTNGAMMHFVACSLAFFFFLVLFGAGCFWV